MKLITIVMSFLKCAGETSPNSPKIVWPTQTSGRAASHILSTINSQQKQMNSSWQSHQLTHIILINKNF